MPSEPLLVGPTSLVVGWTAFLATYLIHSTVWIVIAWQLTRPYMRIPTLLANWLWKLALVGGIITALLQMAVGIPRFWEPLIITQPVAPVGVVEPVEAVRTPVSNPGQALQPRARDYLNLNWPNLVVGLWLGGAALSTAWFVAGWFVFQRRLGVRQPLVGIQLELWRDQVCQVSGIREPIRLTSSRAIASPMVLGHREICIPERALTELSLDQQRSMLAHELAHIARHDPAWLFAAAAIQCLFFFQPLNRLAAFRVSETGEYLCDDWALARTGDGLALARTLSQVATWTSAASAPGLGLGMARAGSAWVRRVERALAWKPHTVEAPRVWWVPLLAGLIVAVSCTVPGVVPQANPAPGPSSTAAASVASTDPTALGTETADVLQVASPTAILTIATGQAISLVWPLTGTIKINQQYWSRHPGLDVSGRMGIPVRAAASGRVVVAGFDTSSREYGNMVWLDHGSGLETLYSHLESYEVKAGDWVDQGQQIAAVGSTGRSTGPHLHFAVSRAGAWQDPTRFLPAP